MLAINTSSTIIVCMNHFIALCIYIDYNSNFIRTYRPVLLISLFRETYLLDNTSINYLNSDLFNQSKFISIQYIYVRVYLMLFLLTDN